VCPPVTAEPRVCHIPRGTSSGSEPPARWKKGMFFEKKNQKTLICWPPRKPNHVAGRPAGGPAKGAKVFYFFFKK
jgi:hypothetical protein